MSSDTTASSSLILEALRFEQEILGPNRKLMSCGCLMRKRPMLDLERSMPGHPVTYYVLPYALMCCDEHVLNCPYIGQRFDE